LLCLAAPWLLAASSRDWARPIPQGWFVGVTAVAAITLPFCYFPSFYAQNGNPPARSLIVPGAILIGYSFFVGWALPARARRAARVGASGLAAALILALIPLGIAAISLPERARAADYAVLWDAEDQLIRASRDAGQTDLIVPALPKFLGEDFVGPNRHDWFNT